MSLALQLIRPPLWGFASELWTRAMVVEVIERMYGVSISEHSAGRIAGAVSTTLREDESTT